MARELNKIVQGDVLEVLKTLEAESVHCVVTSPPYWGLRSYGVDGQYGLEPTPELYVQKMVEVFREVKRVLRSDGTCFINLGDSYWNGGSEKRDGGHSSVSGGKIKLEAHKGSLLQVKSTTNLGLKPKDLCGIPWRVAFALQADGWWLRSDIIWAKPNPMPESVTDRPTKSHEYLFLLAKSKDYFYDAEAIKEPSITDPESKASMMFGSVNGKNNTSELAHAADLGHKWKFEATRNKRSVWTIATQPYKESHFAVFPEDLVIPCIKAGTSEKGCCGKCGSPLKRVLIPDGHRPTGHGNKASPKNLALLGDQKTSAIITRQYVSYKEGGWKPSCSCNVGDPVPCVVLDCFSGAGTSCMVAKKLGRNYIGIELKEEYVKMSERRIDTELGTLF